MSALEQVRQALQQRLESGGIQVTQAYSRKALGRQEQTVLALGVRSLKGESLCFAHYLGQVQDEQTLDWREVYGKRMELELALDVYAPASQGAAAGEAAAEQVTDLLQQGLPSGLKIREISWEELSWDTASAMFRQKGQALCSAYFTAETGEEEAPTLLDFKLKGVVSN